MEAYLEADDIPLLHAALRSAQLNHDRLAVEMLVNMLLRNYIHHKNFDLAKKLVESVVLSHPFASANLAARYAFYVGVIELITLNYSAAFDNFSAANIRAPERALGFRILVTKFLVITQLLMGEVPARGTFMQPTMSVQLRPYLELTSAVRFGSLRQFERVLDSRMSVFQRDRTLTLVERVRTHVLTAGLRRILSAYSRIRLPALAARLGVSDVRDAEYAVAKAAADGLIDVELDTAAGTVASIPAATAYSTTAPAAAFRRRMEYLSNLRDDLVRGLRFAAKEKEKENVDVRV